MDKYGSRYKCKHEECPYKDCNYHYKSTGKYSHKDPDEMWITLPKNEKEASHCIAYMDI